MTEDQASQDFALYKGGEVDAETSRGFQC